MPSKASDLLLPVFFQLAEEAYTSMMAGYQVTEVRLLPDPLPSLYKRVQTREMSPCFAVEAGPLYTWNGANSPMLLDSPGCLCKRY